MSAISEISKKYPEARFVTSDSRQVRSGAVYVAVRGLAQDGHGFIGAAVASGAVVVVGEDQPVADLMTPYIQVPDSRRALAELAAMFAGDPSREMLVIGVTGTSGKTTTTYLLESILKSAGHHVGVVGTVNFRFCGEVLSSSHTTPGAVELQNLLRAMRSKGCTAVVMEVSSHALKQNRCSNIAWDGMVFTNLTPEHLDYHGDLEEYFCSKELLFTEGAEYSMRAGKKPVAVINGEDPFGLRLLRCVTRNPAFKKVSEFRVSPRLSIDLEGVRGVLGSDAGGTGFSSPLIGRFNAENIVAAATIAQDLGISLAHISGGLSSLSAVPGRLQRVDNSKGLNVFVDYAHKPDALEKVLGTLREIAGSGRVLTVFGCGGDRDRRKRPVMGKIAAELSDHVFITSDNPRTEDPGSIIDEIVAGTGNRSHVTIEVDRKKAIFSAIQAARAGDIVLIAGKGHEDYQIIGPSKIHFDDREIAAEAIEMLDTRF